MTVSAPMVVLHAPGTNRDTEAVMAATHAGFDPRIVHTDELKASPSALGDAAALVLPGGFSFGDALGAGVRWALDLRLDFEGAIADFVARGGLVLGICNGFQTLVKANLLDGSPPEGVTKPTRSVTLTHNQSGRFECRWVHLRTESACQAGWLSSIEDLIYCPVAHGEGRFLTSDTDALTGVLDANRVAFRYTSPTGSPADGEYPINPNGSDHDIAGICDSTGQIVGLMPHPEDHISRLQNPMGEDRFLGLALFEAMRKAVV